MFTPEILLKNPLRKKIFGYSRFLKFKFQEFFKLESLKLINVQATQMNYIKN